MNPLIPWAIYVALQAVIRRSQRKSSVPSNQTSSVFPPHPPRRNDSPTMSRHNPGESKANTEGVKEINFEFDIARYCIEVLTEFR